MLPSLIGIIASSGGAVGGDFESIATVTVGSGGSSTITFSSIPSTYKHLQIRTLARSSTSGTTGDYIITRFNSDSAANYSVHLLFGDGGVVASQAFANNNEMWVQRIATAGNSASIFGAAITDILDYADTNKYKTLRTLGGYDANGSGRMDLDSGSWRNTAAVNSISMTCGSGSFQQYSSFALYGIKG